MPNVNVNLKYSGNPETPFRLLGSFNGDMSFHQSGQYLPYTMTTDLNITARNIKLGRGQVVMITIPAGESYNITFGSGIDKLLTSFTNPLTEGNYYFYMYSFIGPDGVTPGVHVNIPDVETPQPPTQKLSTPTLSAAAGNTEITLTLGSIDSNATGGDLEFSTDQSNWNPVPGWTYPTSPYTHTGLTNGIPYYYRFKVTASGFADSDYATDSATPDVITQLTAPTLTNTTGANTQVTIDFTNPNSGNESQNQVYYKLNTEPTTWTTGVVAATSATQVIQTGLTNDLLYDFKIVAEGDGINYSDSPDSNVLSDTPEPYEVESVRLFDRMATAGSDPNTNQRSKINSLISSLKTDGIWDELDCLQVYDMHAENVAMLNWKADEFNGVNNGATWAIDDSFSLDGVDDYLDSNFTPSTDFSNGTLNNFSCGIYLKAITIPTETLNYLFGSVQNSTPPATSIDLAINDSTSSNQFRAGDFTTSNPTQNQTQNSLHSVQRTDANSSFYVEGSNVSPDSTVPSVGLPILPIYLGARHFETGTDFFAECNITSFYAGSASINLQTLRTRLEAYIGTP